MARVTHVKSAQQRYATVPVLNEDGTPKVTPVMRKDGTQRTTKHGKPVTMRVTERDTTKPLPLLSCDFPGCDIDGGKIAVGAPYKHVTPKSGPYGGRQRNRHAAHPSWQVWDLSDSLSANVQRIQSEGSDTIGAAAWESPDDATGDLESIAQEVRDLAETKRESAENIREGFGHDTYQSEELDGVADELESWADDLEGVDIPELPEPEEETCEACNGTGKSDEPTDEDDEPEDCPECSGTGEVVPDEPTEDQMDEWLENAREAAQEALDSCPV